MNREREPKMHFRVHIESPSFDVISNKRDLKLLDEFKNGVFERPAIEAAKRWIYFRLGQNIMIQWRERGDKDMSNSALGERAEEVFRNIFEEEVFSQKEFFNIWSTLLQRAEHFWSKGMPRTQAIHLVFATWNQQRFLVDFFEREKEKLTRISHYEELVQGMLVVIAIIRWYEILEELRNEMLVQYGVDISEPAS